MERIVLACGGNAVNAVDDLTEKDLVINLFLYKFHLQLFIMISIIIVSTIFFFTTTIAFIRDLLKKSMNKVQAKKSTLSLKV